MQDITANIVAHLFIARSCPECSSDVNIALSQMSVGGSVTCGEYGTELEFEADTGFAQRIEGLAGSYDSIEDLLSKRHMPLRFHS